MVVVIIMMMMITLWSPNTVRVIKLRMRWAGQVACTGEGRGVYRVLVGRSEGNTAAKTSA
jgi:hypothetical protein